MIRAFHSAPPSVPAPRARVVPVGHDTNSRRPVRLLRRGGARVVAFACLVAMATVASAAEPISYQGRLIDAAGVPLAGPVTVALHLHEAEGPGGAPLYSEAHASVALDANGVFLVWLGEGTPSAGAYEPSLFQGSPRYLEVVVNGVSVGRADFELLPG